MSKVISIGEHIFNIPTPKKKSDILFINDKDPYWNREKALSDYRDIWYDFIPGKTGTKIYQDATLYDQDGALISLNKEDSEWMIWAYEREWYRRTYGVHIKNDDEITWLSGDHWFTLAWCKTKRPDKISDYFDYREFQAWHFYLLWYVNNNPHSDGLFESKAKKTGITNLMWCYFLNKATMTKNNNLGNMNIDQDKGSKTFRDHFIYAYNGLPLPLKANIKSKSETDGIITFGDRFGNTKKSQRIKNNSDFQLNTTVMCVPTVVNAFDVDVFSDMWFDEPPKYKQDFGEIYRSNAAGTNLQDIAVGKKWLTSYTPEGEAPSFMGAKELFFDSELRTITEHSAGATKSRLICHHMPAFQSWTSSFNKYGKCNEQDSMRKIQFGRDQLKDKPREHQAIIRRYANTKREAWITGGAGSIFDNARLAELEYNLLEEQRNSPDPLFIEGKMEWKNKLWETGLKNKRPKGQFCEVEIVPLSSEEMIIGETGRLRVYQDVPPRLRNLVLKNGRDEWDCLIPPSIFQYTFGADPVQHAAASEVIQGSKNGYSIKSRRDERLDSRYSKVASNTFDMIYYERKELPQEGYEDLVKLIIYCGAIGIVEANVPTTATNLIEEGLGGFMLVRNEEGSIVQWKRHMGLAEEEEKKYHLIRTTSTSADSKKMLEDFVALWKMYIAKPEPGGKDYGASLKDERVISQLMNISLDKPGATRLFDLFMCTGYNHLADEIYSALLLNKPDESAVENIIGSILTAIAS